MAISSVRAQFDDQWYDLTYNSTTGRYEAQLTAPPLHGPYLARVRALSSSGAWAEDGAVVQVQAEKIPPVLEVTTPADNLITAAASVQVTGTASDADSGLNWVTVNGQGVTVNAAGLFTTTVDLDPGENTITVVASDKVGNRTAITRRVSRATAGPSITIADPADGLITNQGAITVSGTVMDNVSPVAAIQVNGQEARWSPGELGEYISFTAQVTLNEGDNVIIVTAANQVALTTAETLSVVRDTTGPVITLTAPTHNQVTANPIITVSGTAFDADSGLDAVTVNGQAVTVGGAGEFSLDITLAEGINTIRAEAVDRAGNRSVESRAVLLDTTDPSLSVRTPPAGLMTNVSRLTISGTASDAGSGLAEVTINGEAVAVNGTGSFSRAVNLAEGYNYFTIVATDQLGHTTTITRTVLLDTVPPEFLTVEIVPNLDANPLGSLYTIRVELVEFPAPKAPESVAGTVNGRALDLQQTGLYVWTAGANYEDGYDVSLRAYDQAGNEAYYTVHWDDPMGSKFDWKKLDFLNYWDLNRMERNTEFITRLLRQYGYGVGGASVKKDWDQTDAPTRSQINRIRANVDSLKNDFPQLPEWLEILYDNHVDFNHTNAIEWDLHIFLRWIDRLAKGLNVYSGEVQCGEV